MILGRRNLLAHQKAILSMIAPGDTRCVGGGNRGEVFMSTKQSLYLEKVVGELWPAGEVRWGRGNDTSIFGIWGRKILVGEVDLGRGDGGFRGGGDERPGHQGSGIALGASEAKPWRNGGDQIRFHTRNLFFSSRKLVVR